MAGLFGTDGVRARINTGPMTAEAVVRLALAAGRWFADHNDRSSHARPIVVIGKDTRLSGYMLESALVAGFTSIGLDCRLLGPIPTPAVAHLTRSLRAELGVMISASHNPHHDNGIKLFGPDGFKLDDKIEAEISALAAGSIALADAPDLGRARRMLDSVGRYVEVAKSPLPGRTRLDGLNLGGEPSGHMLMTDFARSGDGLLTALQMLTLLKASSKKASALFNSFSPNPQRLENLRGIDPAILQDKKLQSDLANIETNLNGKGRVLVRPSGTEALVRVMVEAETEALVTEAMDALILRITAEA